MGIFSKLYMILDEKAINFFRNSNNLSRKTSYEWTAFRALKNMNMGKDISFLTVYLSKSNIFWYVKPDFLPCNAQISQLDDLTFCEENVLSFQVSMQDVSFMHILKK